jgi:hypothetical protein
MAVSDSLLFLYDKIFLIRLCHVQNISVLMFSRGSNVRWCSDYIKLLGKLEGLYDGRKDWTVVGLYRVGES